MTYQEVYLLDNLTIEAKAIYGMLCSYAGVGAEAYPSVDFMCKKLHISNTRFYKHMNLLIGAGIVERKQTKNEKGAFVNNTYILAPNLQNIQNTFTENLQEGNPLLENVGMGNGGNNNTNINNTSINNNINKKSSKRFTPPTVEEVAAYCRERGNRVDPQRFVDFYEAKGWMIGKNKMKSWKSAVHTWENRDNCGSQRVAVPEPVQRPEYMEHYKNLPSSPDDPFQ